MKKIGLLGGMSWESSVLYYQYINRKVQEHLGGNHSAECILYSVDFQRIIDLQFRGDWEQATLEMIHAAQQIEKAGADCLLICTNTMHKMAKEVQENIAIPLIHIADATAKQIQADGLHRVGLLATKFTMEHDFYKGLLAEKYQTEVLIPNNEERPIVHDIIYHELCLGNIKQESKQKYLTIINNLINQGAEGIILGCTEIPLLIKPEDVPVPIYDTTMIHAYAAVDWALGRC